MKLTDDAINKAVHMALGFCLHDWKEVIYDSCPWIVCDKCKERHTIHVSLPRIPNYKNSPNDWWPIAEKNHISLHWYHKGVFGCWVSFSAHPWDSFLTTRMCKTHGEGVCLAFLIMKGEISD
jgi:hypothetical protein